MIRRLIPGSGIVTGVPILKQNHFPDFIDSQVLLPGRHDGGPGEPFIRQSNSTLGNTPEDERFLQLCDRTWIGKVCRNWIERKSVQSSAIQIISMAEVAILEKDLASLSHVLQIPCILVVPWIGVRLHQTPHTLLNNIAVREFLVVFSLGIDPVGILRGLQGIGLTVDLCARWRRRMNRS